MFLKNLFSQPLENTWLDNFLGNIEKNKAKIFYLLIATIFFGWIFYNRLFFIRLPRDLNVFHFSLIILGAIIIMVQLINAIKIFKTIYDKTQNKIKKKSVIKKYLKKFRRKTFHIDDLIFWARVKYFFDIKQRIDDAYASSLNQVLKYPLLCYFSHNLIFTFRKYFSLNSAKYFHFFIFIFPKILLLIVLISDIYFFEINYFYKTLWLLLIPLLGRLIRFTCQILAILQNNFFCNVIQISRFYTKEEFINEMAYFYDEQDDVNYMYTWADTVYLLHATDKELHEKFMYLLPFMKMYDFMEISNDLEQESIKLMLINIVINFVTIICWGTIIYLMLQLI